MALTHAQQVGLALGPKFSGSLSILGSSWIIFEVLRDKKKQAMVYHRLLLGLSIFDVIISFAWFLSTWPVPAETEGMRKRNLCSVISSHIILEMLTPPCR